MTPPLFLADAAAMDGDMVVLDGTEGRHAADVKRLRPGEPVLVADGAGLLVTGTVAEAGRGRVVVAVTGRTTVPPPEPRFVVVQALAKGGRDTDAVEAMTEVGVDEIVGWTAARSIAKASDRVADRWRTVSRAASKQARRPRLPVVTGPVTTAHVTARLAAADLAIVLHGSAAASLAGAEVPARGEVVIVVGPEGGITDDELELFAGVGASSRRLGDMVLRTSTAGVAALSVLSAATRWQ